MTVVNTRHSTMPEAVFHAFRTWLGQIYNHVETRIAAHRAYHRTLGELQALSDRDLRDIGIPRSHIRRVALEDSRRVRTNG